MNRVIRFFSYEQCYQHYTKRIMNIKQAKIHGETIVAKPVLLVAIIDGIEANVFRSNQFVINDWMEGRYKLLMQQYTRGSQFDGTTGIEKPFWHLETDGFWHLNYQGERLAKSRTPSKPWLKVDEKEKIERDSNSPSSTCLYGIHPMKRNPYGSERWWRSPGSPVCCKPR